MQTKTTEIPFIDLRKEYQSLEQEWLSEIKKIGSRASFILGENVTALEQEIAGYLGTEYGVTVANGTDALVLSLKAKGIKPGDEVIVSPFTFFASSEAIDLVGATPVFADILPDSFNLDPTSVREHVTDKTRAILVVHIFGCAAEMTKLLEIAKQRELVVIEDCAQAFGASYQDKKVGSFGDTGCFSFYPTKLLGCYGDGGIIVTDSAEVTEHLKRLRNHGTVAPFIHSEIGTNSRLDEIQAALLRIKLRKIDISLLARRKIAGMYNERLNGVVKMVPSVSPADSSVVSGHGYNLYTLRVANRDKLRQYLSDNGVHTALCYPQPLHLQTIYSDLGYRPGELPVAEQACKEVLSLPIYPDMPLQHIETVCELVTRFAEEQVENTVL